MKSKREKKNRAVIYARYSSHNQNDMSIEQQVQLGRELAARLGIPVLEVYADRAVSGRTDNRPFFQKMLRDAADGMFNVVIAWKSSRIGRNMLEALTNENTLRTFGVVIRYVEEEFADNAAGRFAARSMMNVNQFYSEAMAEDIRRGLRSVAQECKVTGAIPYGYKISADKHYEIDEDKALIVQELFRRVAAGEIFADIVRDFNQRGLRTSKGGAWNKNSFPRILTNERYRGVYMYQDIRIEGGIPRIVDDDLYFYVQQVLQNKVPNEVVRRGDYMLTGKLFCGECKEPMVGVSGTSKSKSVYRYYDCRNHRVGLCKKKPVQKETVEKAIARVIRDNILQPEVMEWITDSVMEYQKKQKDNPELEILRSQLADVQFSIDNIMKAIEKGIFTATTKEHLLNYEDQKEALKEKIAAAEFGIVEVSREYVVKWLEGFRAGDIENAEVQRMLFDDFLDSVYLYDDNRLTVIFTIGGGKNKEISIELIEESREEDCVLINSRQPHQTGLIRTQKIIMINGAFVLFSSI